uniref:Neprosin activation peptide domain-containing protein n=1 Tax=Setaria digitata TaxID=48799 RepID=A0A915Q2T1_9BILA
MQRLRSVYVWRTPRKDDMSTSQQLNGLGTVTFWQPEGFCTDEVKCMKAKKYTNQADVSSSARDRFDPTHPFEMDCRQRKDSSTISLFKYAETP